MPGARRAYLWLPSSERHDKGTSLGRLFFLRLLSGPAGPLGGGHTGTGGGGESPPFCASAMAARVSIQSFQHSDGFFQPLHFPFGAIAFQPQLCQHTVQVWHVLSL